MDMERSTQQQKAHCLQDNFRTSTTYRTPDRSQTLRTPGIEEDTFLQLSVTPTSLYLSFDMEETLNPSQPDSLVEQDLSAHDVSSIDDITSFVDMLKSSSDKIKFEAASALFHVLSINHANTVVECGAVPLLLNSLGSPKQSVRDECAKCLGKIAGFSPQLRDHVINQDGLSRLLQHLEYSSDDLSLDTLLEATSQFFLNKSRPNTDMIKHLFPTILSLLSQDKEASIIIAACKIISYLAEDSPSTSQMFLEAGAKKKLMQLLTHRDESAVAMALRAIRYLVPPKSTIGREVVSAVSTAPCPSPTWEPEEKSTPKTWLLSPLLGDKLHGIDIRGLREIDVLTCQNVEMFKSLKVDESQCGAFFKGQIGIRCLHCGRSPFATVEFSTVFPASIDHVAASLRHMSKHHLSNCRIAPPQVRYRISQLYHNLSSDETTTSFEYFCQDLCGRFGVVSHYPPKSGLNLQQDDFHQNSESFLLKESTLGKHIPKSDDTSDHPQRQPSPELNTKHFPPAESVLSTSKSGNIWRNHVDPARPTTGVDFAAQKTVFEQESHGAWRCNMCRYSPIEVPSSIWRGHHPPSRAFIDSHAKECPGLYDNNTTNFGKQNPRQNYEEDIHQYNRYVDGVDNPPMHPSTQKKDRSKDHRIGKKDVQDRPMDHLIGKKNVQDRPMDHLIGKKDVQDRPMGHLLKKKAQVDLLLPEDKAFLSDLTIFVLQQLKVCYFTGSSVTKPKGFPGLACIHCGDKKGGRKYFWTCPERFKNNSSTFTKHLEECKHCPDSVKNKLEHYKSYHGRQMSRLPRGTITQFFKRMFFRIHGENSNLIRNPPIKTKANEKKKVATNPNAPVDMERPQVESSGLAGRNPPTQRKDDDYAIKSMPFDFSGENDMGVMSKESKLTVLGLPNDNNWLRDKETLLRQNIEVFRINSNDAISIPNVSSSPNTIGFRCLHCSRRKPCKGMSDRSAFFVPLKLEKIREAAIAFSQHLSFCPNAPDDCREAFKEPLSCFGSDLYNDYYVRSARDIGLYDDSRMGIMMIERKEHTPSPSGQPFINHMVESDAKSLELSHVDVSNDFNPPLNLDQPTATSGTKRPVQDNSSLSGFLAHSPLFKRQRSNHPASVDTENDSSPLSQPYQI